jgi:hypothetical protein
MRFVFADMGYLVGLLNSHVDLYNKCFFYCQF